MAGSAGFDECVGARFAIWAEVPSSLAARCRVLFRVLDHELNVCRGAGNDRLYFAKDLVVLI